jgi:cell division protein FtsN
VGTTAPSRPQARPEPTSTTARVATHAPTELATITPSQTASGPSAITPPSETGTAPSPDVTANSGAPPAAAPKETPKPSAGGYLLQIGSYKSEDEANTAWRAFQASHSMVSGYRSDVKEVDLGEKGTWYRLRIGSFADKSAAAEFCAKLKSDGANCLVGR